MSGIKFDREYFDQVVTDMFKPGAVIVSCGNRGGGKTHCAISYCQRLMEGYFKGGPKNVILLTNVIFIKRVPESVHPKGFKKEAPKGVYMVETMREIFPIIESVLKKYGRKDTLIILLLDEAQNFLLGDENNRSDMAVSMKKFCGIIRKFRLALWLISPAMRNLGPAFRNYLDADNDPGNVNCTFEKDKNRSIAYLNSRGSDMDYRSLAFVKQGEKEQEMILPVPTSSWTRKPEEIALGEYVYDNEASAFFDMGEFPFNDFVQYISGKSSYDMSEAIGEFYRQLEMKDAGEDVNNGMVKKIRLAYAKEIAPKLRKLVKRKYLAPILGVSETTISNWCPDTKDEEESSEDEKAASETGG